jgi:hypothetical protein
MKKTTKSGFTRVSGLILLAAFITSNTLGCTGNAPSPDVAASLEPIAEEPALSVPTPTPGLDFSTTHLSDNGLFRVSYASSQDMVPVNKIHQWTLHIETADGQLVENATIAVDGDMPEHGHGLPTRPQVTEYLGNGDYLVEGVKFQMGGWWVMDFDVTVAGQTDRVSFNLMLK